MIKPFPFTEREIKLVHSAFFLFSDLEGDDVECTNPMDYTEQEFVDTLEIAVATGISYKRELYVILGKYLINKELMN